MKVIAVNIDNVLADTESALSAYLYDKFADVFDFDKFDNHEEGWQAFALEHPEKAMIAAEELIEGGKLYNLAKPITKNIEELNKWAWAGAVISIVCARSNKHRLLTELWLAQNQVPYSNLLFNIDYINVDTLLASIDAQVYVDSEPGFVGLAAETLPSLSAYLLRTFWNDRMVPEFQEMLEERGAEVTIVDYLDQIAEAEGIRTRG